MPRHFSRAFPVTRVTIHYQRTPYEPPTNTQRPAYPMNNQLKKNHYSPFSVRKSGVTLQKGYQTVYKLNRTYNTLQETRGITR